MADSSPNREWGPALWMILHSSAERIGTKSLKRLPHEEGRLWLNLLLSLRTSLPCPICKKHYSEWIQRHPLPAVHALTRDGMRQWLFQLHQAVRERTAQENSAAVAAAVVEDPWTIERVAEVYSAPFHFSKHHAVVLQHMMKAFRGGWLHREDIHKSARAFEEVKRFYDFF